jgi:hypothetical protein
LSANGPTPEDSRFFPKRLYKLRARIEQTIGKLKCYKRVPCAARRPIPASPRSSALLADSCWLNPSTRPNKNAGLAPARLRAQPHQITGNGASVAERVTCSHLNQRVRRMNSHRRHSHSGRRPGAEGADANSPCQSQLERDIARPTRLASADPKPRTPSKRRRKFWLRRPEHGSIRVQEGSPTQSSSDRPAPLRARRSAATCPPPGAA